MLHIHKFICFACFVAVAPPNRQCFYFCYCNWFCWRLWELPSAIGFMIVLNKLSISMMCWVNNVYSHGNDSSGSTFLVLSDRQICFYFYLFGNSCCSGMDFCRCIKYFLCTILFYYFLVPNSRWIDWFEGDCVKKRESETREVQNKIAITMNQSIFLLCKFVYFIFVSFNSMPHIKCILE